MAHAHAHTHGLYKNYNKTTKQSKLNNSKKTARLLRHVEQTPANNVLRVAVGQRGEARIVDPQRIIVTGLCGNDKHKVTAFQNVCNHNAALLQVLHNCCEWQVVGWVHAVRGPANVGWVDFRHDGFIEVVGGSISARQIGFPSR